jgi:predicted SprT family Zn-dependent metalloprotease
MLVPTAKERRLIQRLLISFFNGGEERDFKRAVKHVCNFYKLKPPKVKWFERLDWGSTAGRTYDNGEVHLVHPENWKKGRKYNKEGQWVETVLHEMGHYVFWVDAERKAQAFAQRMLK